jgi:hypothetical protein
MTEPVASAIKAAAAAPNPMDRRTSLRRRERASIASLIEAIDSDLARGEGGGNDPASACPTSHFRASSA